MAAYRPVYDPRHLQADCQKPESAPEPPRSVIEYGLPLPFLVGTDRWTDGRTAADGEHNNV